MDYQGLPGDILDEIALEGLDGITISALWTRLRTRKGFSVALDDASMKYIWALVCKNKSVQMFMLQKPRPTLKIHNRYDHYEPELDMVCEPEELSEDIYPVDLKKLIDDKMNRIRGSCLTYHTRINCTDQVKKLSLPEATEMYGDRLVLVASQVARSTALAGIDAEALASLSIISYTVLERIGRSREYGEVTAGRHGLQRLNMEAKALFRFRQELLTKKVAVQQAMSMVVSGKSHNCYLLHIPRFYSLKPTKTVNIMTKMFEMLKQSPLHTREFSSICSDLNLTSRRLYQILAMDKIARHMKVLQVPYRTCYPDATEKEWKVGDKEKVVKAVCLFNPKIELGDVFDEVSINDLESESSVENDGTSTTTTGLLPNWIVQTHNQSIVRQAYALFEAIGPTGLNENDLSEKLGLPKLDARMILRALVRLQMVDKITKDLQKTSVFMYVARNHFGANELRTQLEQGKQQLVELMENGESSSTDSDNVLLKKQDSLRESKRIIFILEALQKDSVVEFPTLFKMIRDQEKKDGYKTKLDRRTLIRICSELVRGGKLVQKQIILNIDESPQTLDFISKLGVDSKRNAVICSAIQRVKMKHYKRNRRNRKSEKVAPRNEVDKIFNVAVDSATLKEARKQLSSNEAAVIGWKHGYEAKCIRIKVLHHYLFYLVYGYTGQDDLDQSEIKRLLKSRYHLLNDEMLEDIPPIYQPELGWKMFIKKLPENPDWTDGWCLLRDVFHRMPLSVFVKIVNVNYRAEELDDYLKHPIKQHFPLMDLPKKLLQALISSRWYIHSVLNVLANMTYFGLTQLGPCGIKVEGDVRIYLNRKTTILDTTVSAPGYQQISRDINYEVKSYFFKSMVDIFTYWNDVHRICLGTRLSNLNSEFGQIAQGALKKKPDMIAALRVRTTADEAKGLDNGSVPGDRLGAAGFDSAFSAHAKKKWTIHKTTVVANWSASKSYYRGLIKDAVSSVRMQSLKSRATRFEECTTIDGEKVVIPVTMETNIRHTSKGMKRKRASKENEPAQSSSASKRKRQPPKASERVDKPRKQGQHIKPLLDEKDQLARLAMRRLRVVWTSDEQEFLFLCKVANVYIYGNMRQNVSARLIRDCLHDAVSESRDKTAQSCQRRMGNKLRDPTFVYHVENAYEELKNYPDIVSISNGGPITEEERAKGAKSVKTIANIRFRSVLEHLKKRYAPGGNSTDTVPSLNLPNTLKEFHSKYRLKLHQTGLRLQRPILEVANRDEIISATVFNVVHSALCVEAKEKSKLGSLLFDVCKSFPDATIRENLKMMRKDTMVVRHKGANQSVPKNQELSLESGENKLSISYTHLLRSGYPFSIFNQTFEYFQRFLDEKKKSETLDDWQGMEVSRIFEGGSSAMALTMFALSIASIKYEIPEKTLLIDPRLKENPIEYEALMKRYNRFLLDIEKAAEKAAAYSKHDIRDLRGRFQPKEPSVKVVTQKDTAESRISKGKQLKSTVQCGPVASSSDTEFDSDRSSKQKIPQPKVSRFSLHMLRDDLSQEDSSETADWCPQPKIKILQEHLVLNPCQVYVDVQSPETLEILSTNSQAKKQEVIESVVVIPSEAPPSLAHCWALYDRKGLKKKAKAAASKILELIQSKQEMGILASDLPVEVGKLESSCSLERHMSLLTESKLVLRVGVVAARYVSFYHINPWLVPSYRITATVDPLQESSDEATLERNARKSIDKEITEPAAKRAKIIEIVETEERTDVMLSLKPWVKVDGEINRPVLDRLLGAVLSHIMTRPGCTILQLTQRFHPAFQPFQIRELVEILGKIECVKLYCLKKSGKPGLFAPRTTVEIAPFNPFSSDKDVYCDPKVDAILRLGNFIGKKEYEDDYVPNCPCHDGQ